MRNLIIKQDEGKKRIFIPLIFLFLFSISLSFVVAAPPAVSVQTTVQGIAIEHPLSSSFEVNKTHKFHFHLFNSSTGLAIPSTTATTCSFHLYAPDGSHIYKKNFGVSGDDVLDYEALLTGSNFSYAGNYAFVFQCNTSTIGGYYAHDFEVTQQGNVGGSNNDNYFWILIVLTWGVAFIGFFGKNVWVSVFGGMGMIIFGIYTLTQGIIIYENWVTQAISYFSMGLGAFFMIYSLLEYLQNEGDF